jgi:beta-glucosidase
MALFPKHFLWGASTAAHQVEGNNHNQWSVWELENAKTHAAQAHYHLDDLAIWPLIKGQATQPDTYVSGALADHYHRYEEDFHLLTAMHMNAYRFSVEWSRIEPQEGSWDAAEIAHYKDYVKALKKRDIEPVMTLFHFTLPEWFTAKGGFTKRANVKYFVRFAEKIVSEIGLDVRYILTVNEPDIYAYESYLHQEWPPAQRSKRDFVRVVFNLALAHKKAAKAIHDLNRVYKVSFADNVAFYYPGDDAWLSRLSTEWLHFWKNIFITNRFVKSCDFLSLNYYFTNRVYGYRVHNPDERLSDMGWDMHPADIEFVLETLSRKYKLPILISENGLADAQDKDRRWWLEETIKAMQRAMKHDVKLIGYLHWSLIDNFEWANGKWPRFGLAAVDYKTGKRTLRPSAVWFGKTLKKIRGV